jgi:serine/threonine-protein kinase
MPSREDIVREAEARLGASLKHKWRLEAMLGFGGMASVYRAVHRNGKRVAIKVLHAHLTADRTVRSRFLREGYIANSIEHPAVVSILDDDVAGDVAFLIAELVDGETLEQLRAANRLARAQLLHAIAELLEVLAIAHHAGIIHRDLKPENLMLARNGGIKVLDFGLAHARDVHDADLTGPGTLLGTPHFIAPEQAAGRWNLVDAQTDLWAVGATMFRLLTGRYVHEGSGTQAVLAQAATEPAPSLRDHLPDAPEALVVVVDRALAFSKADRFEDARAMRHALEAAAAACGADIAPTPDSAIAPVQREATSATRTRGWVPAILVAGAAALVVSNLPTDELSINAGSITPSIWVSAPAPSPSAAPPLASSAAAPRRAPVRARPAASVAASASASVTVPQANPLDRRK